MLDPPPIEMPVLDYIYLGATKNKDLISHYVFRDADKV